MNVRTPVGAALEQDAMPGAKGGCLAQRTKDGVMIPENEATPTDAGRQRISQRWFPVGSRIVVGGPDFPEHHEPALVGASASGWPRREMFTSARDDAESRHVPDIRTLFSHVRCAPNPAVRCIPAIRRRDQTASRPGSVHVQLFSRVERNWTYELLTAAFQGR